MFIYIYIYIYILKCILFCLSWFCWEIKGCNKMLRKDGTSLIGITSTSMLYESFFFLLLAINYIFIYTYYIIFLILWNIFIGWKLTWFKIKKQASCFYQKSTIAFSNPIVTLQTFHYSLHNLSAKHQQWPSHLLRRHHWINSESHGSKGLT
jgi:hypothetical protein